jgi:ribosome-associated protein|tara:strand:- start:63 stop:413 length:351 start_codon:yes stop_codon:yes gene_type:complete
MEKVLYLKKTIEQILNDNKAIDVNSVDLKDKSSVADYMIIASGTSSRHLQALSEMILKKLKKEGISNCHLEGKDSNEWKLIDGVDIIIHIFSPEKRKFYNLEKMWAELLPKERLMI